MTMTAPTLVPELVHVTAHARQRYGDRRNTNPDAVDRGLLRLLRQAARKPTPPLRCIEGHRAHRSIEVGGFMLVFDADLRTLITLWRHVPPFKARSGRRIVR